MTGNTSTSGAEWKGGGEAKALGRMFGPEAVEDDEDEAPPLKVPASAVYQATQDEIDLAAQTQIAADALKEAEGVEHYRLRAGNELLKLRAIFLRVELGRDAIIERMKEEGHSRQSISAALGISVSTFYRRYAAIEAKRPLRVSLQAHGRFLTWAANKLDRKKPTLKQYMSFAREPERLERYTRNKNTAAKIGAAILAAQKRPGVPEPLRRAFQALPVPARERWLVWGASLLIGSDDPQTIARWFAKRFTQ